MGTAELLQERGKIQNHAQPKSNPRVGAGVDLHYALPRKSVSTPPAHPVFFQPGKAL